MFFFPSKWLSRGYKWCNYNGDPSKASYNILFPTDVERCCLCSIMESGQGEMPHLFRYRLKSHWVSWKKLMKILEYSFWWHDEIMDVTLNKDGYIHV